MKKSFLCSIILLPSILFSYDLEFNKEFSEKINNDKLSTNIRVVINSKKEYFINESIEFFQEFIDDDTTITKRNGNYSLVPNYSYQNNKQIFVDYKGILSYNIQTSNPENLNEFISELNRIKNNINKNEIQLSISNIKWIVSKELYDKSIDNIRLKSVNWIKDYIKSLDDNCIVKNITINKNNRYLRSQSIRAIAMNKSKNLNISPSKTKQDIKLNVNYKLECK